MSKEAVAEFSSRNWEKSQKSKLRKSVVRPRFKSGKLTNTSQKNHQLNHLTRFFDGFRCNYVLVFYAKIWWWRLILFPTSTSYSTRSPNWSLWYLFFYKRSNFNYISTQRKIQISLWRVTNCCWNYSSPVRIFDGLQGKLISLLRNVNIFVLVTASEHYINIHCKYASRIIKHYRAALTLYSCIREVLRSNIDGNSGYTD
jgi:hypothetical protein